MLWTILWITSVKGWIRIITPFPLTLPLYSYTFGSIYELSLRLTEQNVLWASPIKFNKFINNLWRKQRNFIASVPTLNYLYLYTVRFVWADSQFVQKAKSVLVSYYTFLLYIRKTSYSLIPISCISGLYHENM